MAKVDILESEVRNNSILLTDYFKQNLCHTKNELFV